MKQYLNLLKNIKENGIEKNDRTGTGTLSIFGMQEKYNLKDGFPLVTTKKTFLRIIIVELIWIIRGDTNIKYLVDRKCHIWDEWPFQNWLENSGEYNSIDYPKHSKEWLDLKKEFIGKIKDLPKNNSWVIKWGDLGPIYGHQWRNFNTQGVDQIKNVIKQIKENPDSRRIIVSAWNPIQMKEMLLPPCHSFFQFNVDTKNKTLNLQLYQRSADMFLGVPFNIASYSVLLILIAKITNLNPGTFTHTLGDAHIYKNHIEQVNQQLENEPLPLPSLEILKDLNSLEDIEELEWSDFKLHNYKSHKVIKAPVAV